MTTKRERGRDPEQHVVHASRAEANAFTGMHGQLTFVAGIDVADAKAILEARAHNGLKPGGYIVPMIPSEEVRSPLTFASVPPNFVAPAMDDLLISHELGYIPLVQVLDAVGNIVPMDLITANTATTSVAGPASNNTNDHTHASPSMDVEASVVTVEQIWRVVQHDDENLTIINYTAEPLTVILR